MTRKLLLLAAAITMMFALAPTTSVDAQTCTTYNGAIRCGGPVLALPAGGFTNAPSSGASAATGSTSTTTASAGTAETTQGLAFTGAESQVLGYIGAGLIGLGGLSLVAARRRSSDSTN